MKVETKAQLRERIAELEKENAFLIGQLNSINGSEMQRKIPLATARCLGALHHAYPCRVSFVRFEHFDASGYWFSYRLTNDLKEYTYCVRHSEVDNG